MPGGGVPGVLSLDAELVLEVTRIRLSNMPKATELAVEPGFESRSVISQDPPVVAN